ncbi:MAG: GNAT family N-acetyltransferase [Planctomycetota bacterium]
MNLTFCPVTEDRWSDFECLIESRGGPHNCWCMAWRNNEHAKTIAGKAGKKAAIRKRVTDATPIGLLAYSDGESIAWCSIASRNTHKPLGGDPSLDDVWSVTCFFVKRQFRSMGISHRLLEAAIDFAEVNGARHVEAYPVDTDSPSYRFMGFVPMFESAGFRFVQMAGSRRKVMVLDLPATGRFDKGQLFGATE